MTNNPNEHRNDTVLGGSQILGSGDDVALRGLAGVKQQLASAVVEQRVASLSQALQYGEEGLELAIAALKDKTGLVQQTAYSLLCQSSEPRVKQILQEYDPLLYRRGIECFDVNDWMVLIQAPLEQVAQMFSQMRQVEHWERDVYEREVETQEGDVVVFQFRQHSWTVIHSYCVLGYFLEKEDAQSLSSLLHTRAFFYRVSDTGGFIKYHLYKNNELVEELNYGGGNIEQEDEQGNVRDILRYPTQFQSRLRQIEAKDIEDAWSFTENLILEQDAYVPLVWLRELEPNEQVTLQIYGLRPRVFARQPIIIGHSEFFKRDDFERVDYMVVK